MAKAKNLFYCKECGTEVSKWQGQCPGCGEWNTLVEAPASKTPAGRGKATVFKPVAEPSRMKDITIENEQRMLTGICELDRVLGGGIVPGSLVLVGGDPGIGKSTLLLQMCKELSDKERKVLYVSGEESLGQIKLRGNRIGEFQESVYLLSETSISAIDGAIEKVQPEVVIVDSIQTMYDENIDAAPGSISQVSKGVDDLVIVGIKTRGLFLANRLAANLKRIENVDVPVGALDVSDYRDDLSKQEKKNLIHNQQLDFDITDKKVVLVDDVLFTGRTIRAALDALMDQGRPATISLAVLVDRGHRELPVRPDFIGKNIPTAMNERIKVSMTEVDDQDSINLVTK